MWNRAWNKNVLLCLVGITSIYITASWPFFTFVTELSLVSFHTQALAILAVAVARTVWNLALFIPYVALLALPTRLADTLAVYIISLARTEKRAHT